MGVKIGILTILIIVGKLWPVPTLILWGWLNNIVICQDARWDLCKLFITATATYQYRIQIASTHLAQYN